MQADRKKSAMFLAGFGIACWLAFSVQAAQQQVAPPDRYDANFIFAGMALQIVDHETNTMYLYGFDSKDEGKYQLTRTVDLTQAGQPEIRFEKHEDEKAQGQ